MRKFDVQSTKVICCNRFSDKINVLEYPEFVVIRKEYKFTMEIVYFEVNKFKYLGNCIGQRLC